MDMTMMQEESTGDWTSNGTVGADDGHLPARFALIPPHPYLILQAGFLTFTLIATIYGNVSVGYVVYRTRSIATATGMSMTSLAIADLLRGCFVLPFIIVSSIELGHWTMGPTLCSLVGFCNTLFASASVINLAMVSVDRYIAIMKPLKYASIITTRRASLGLMLVWSLSFTMAILPVIGWSEYRFIPWTCLCIPDWTKSRSYAYTYLVVTFLIPLCTLLHCYYKIFRIARRQSRRVVSLELASMELSRSVNTPVARGKPKVIMRKEKKAAVILCAVLGVFMVCVTPFCVVYIVSSYDVSEDIYSVLGITSLLSFVNSAANPLIYGILNRKFRRVFVELITCKFCPCRKSKTPLHREDFVSEYEGKGGIPAQRDKKYTTRTALGAHNHNGAATRCGAKSHVFAISLASTSAACVGVLGGNLNLNLNELGLVTKGRTKTTKTVGVRGRRQDRVVCFKDITSDSTSNVR